MSNRLEKSKSHKDPAKYISTFESTWMGPLPPPQVLSQFDQAHPGAAKIIIEAFQEQSRHRQELEKLAISSNIAKEKRGQHYGFAIGVIGILCGTTCILLGHEWPGAAVIGVDLISLVSVFIIGKTKQTKDLQKKDNIKMKS